MKLIEYGALDLERERNISRFIREHKDLIILFFMMACFTAYAYQSFYPVMPFVLLLMIYVIADDNEDQVKDKNDVKINHALKQNNWFESVRENAYKWVDEA